MQRELTKAIIIAVLAVVLFLGNGVIEVGNASEVKRFDDYPATETFNGTPAKLDTSRFLDNRPWVHDHIKETVTEGPNFAGAYSLVWVPCGTECISVFAFDLRDGRIIWLGSDASGVSFEKDSRLLIVTRYLGGENFEDVYYVLENDTFREVD